MISDRRSSRVWKWRRNKADFACSVLPKEHTTWGYLYSLSYLPIFIPSTLHPQTSSPVPLGLPITLHQGCYQPFPATLPHRNQMWPYPTLPLDSCPGFYLHGWLMPTDHFFHTTSQTTSCATSLAYAVQVSDIRSKPWCTQLCTSP